jgi:hypothetical protein
VRAAERFGIGVCTKFRRQDAFAYDHPHFLGHLGLAVPDGTQQYQLPRSRTVPWCSDYDFLTGAGEPEPAIH